MHQEEEKEGAEHRQTGENEQTKTKERNETWGYFQHKSHLFTFDRDLIRMLVVDIKGQLSVGMDQRGSLGLY